MRGNQCSWLLPVVYTPHEGDYDSYWFTIIKHDEPMLLYHSRHDYWALHLPYCSYDSPSVSIPSYPSHRSLNHHDLPLFLIPPSQNTPFLHTITPNHHEPVLHHHETFVNITISPQPQSLLTLVHHHQSTQLFFFETWQYVLDHYQSSFSTINHHHLQFLFEIHSH